MERQASKLTAEKVTGYLGRFRVSERAAVASRPVGLINLHPAGVNYFTPLRERQRIMALQQTRRTDL
jgi:hypothetical protein